MSQLAANLQSIQQQIRDALTRASRPKDSVRLVAVSKKHPATTIAELATLGQEDFGENYVQEWLEKSRTLEGTLPRPIRWHFIGHLQKNKVKPVVGQVRLIHSVDSLALAEKISAAAATLNLSQSCLLEINVSGEESKTGFPVAEFHRAARALAALPNIAWRGLMTMAPASGDAEESRPVFRALRELLQEIQKQEIFLQNFNQLSMGMSDDFVPAIEEGATLVRIGSALLGPRL